jgi:methylmalonyl-CoA/ethylmalonyl-CoA epimerase
MLKKLDHIGIAVQSLKSVKSFFKTIFNLDPVFEETVEEQKVKVVGFKLGETNLEFLEPTAADSPIAKYLKKRGEGLHHIALGVDDIPEILNQLKDKGLRLIDETPREGASGKQIAFIHPKSMFGILTELSQEK